MNTKHQGRAEVGLQHDQASGTAASASTSSTSGRGWTSLGVAPLGQQHRHPDDQRDLGELGRLDLEPAGSTIHECAPLMVEPTGDSTTTRPRQDAA